MPTIKHVESQIKRIEGFPVKIRYGQDGRDIRSDKSGVPGYRYTRQLTGTKTVAEWRAGRFSASYPGFEVDVLRPDGSVAHGRTLLASLRDE
ncbi:MAG TPA: hypothetical protein VGQ20_16775 [Acidimicrobiales bacterium]|nr:hypothetical protein [Acidimicrobiales bacterium]